MKEIRHFIKRVTDFPNFLVEFESLNLQSFWNDVFINISGEINNTSRLVKLNFTEIKKDKNLIGLHFITGYLITDPGWDKKSLTPFKIVTFLEKQLPEFSKNVSPYTEWMNDQERAEELVRSLFSVLGLLPEGESKKYFFDRLRSIDTIERIRILEESKKAQERAKELLRKIKQAEEEEAASKYNRE